MKLNYLIVLGTASAGLLGYYIYQRYKNQKRTIKNKIRDYDVVMKVLKKLEKKIISKKDDSEFRQTLLNQFIKMVEESKRYSCENTDFPLEKFNKILEENKDEPNIKEYLEGYKTMCNLPSDFKNVVKMRRIVTELLVLWDKKISSTTEYLCIESLFCHYEILNILDTKDVNDADFNELIVRIHNLYLNDVLEIARNHDYNYIEFYTALAVNFHFRSRMLLFHKSCADDIMRTCSFLMNMDKNEEIDINESIRMFMDTTEKSFRECKDFVNKRMEMDESLNYKDLIKDKEFQKFDCYLMHDLWENNKMGEVKTYYDMMYTLKKNFENDDLKTDIFNYSRMIDIPYKFIMEYIKINSELDQLGLIRQKSLFIDYNIVQRQAVSLIAMQLMEENRARDSYELFTNYISILDDEEVNVNSERLKREIENKSGILLSLYEVDRDTLDIICFLFKNSNNEDIKKWRDDCIKQLDEKMNYQLFFLKRNFD